MKAKPYFVCCWRCCSALWPVRLRQTNRARRNPRTAPEPAVESSAPEESGSEEPFEPAYSTVVSRGKPYTGPTAVDSYPDTYGSELTDGLYAEGDLGYSDPRWSDYGKPDPLTFTIDLGEIVDRIYMFEISYYHEIGPGIGTPQAMRVEWSVDGETWDDLSAHLPRAGRGNRRLPRLR